MPKHMILDDIIFNKRQEVIALKVRARVENFKEKVKELPPTRDFAGALKKEGLSLIAEIKKASPSSGILRREFHPPSLGQIYERHGASAISILTDEKYFEGSLDHLRQVREVTAIPLLRKDFVIDEDQLYESRIAGADAVLLIARVLSAKELEGFIKLSRELDLDPLVEVHSVAELERALQAKAQIIGINNRDLDTLEVDLNITSTFIDQIPKTKRDQTIVVSESGIHSREDVELLKGKGVDALLIGEALLKSEDIQAKIKELMGW